MNHVLLNGEELDRLFDEFRDVASPTGTATDRSPGDAPLIDEQTWEMLFEPSQGEGTQTTQLDGLRPLQTAHLEKKIHPPEGQSAELRDYVSAVIGRLAELRRVAERSNELVADFLIKHAFGGTSDPQGAMHALNVTLEMVDRFHWLLTNVSNRLEALAAPALRFSPTASLVVELQQHERATVGWSEDGNGFVGKTLELHSLVCNLAISKHQFALDQAEMIATKLPYALMNRQLGLPGFVHERVIDGKTLILRRVNQGKWRSSAQPT